MTLLTLVSSLGLASTTWQHPPPEVQSLLDAPEVPATSVAPDAETLLLMTPVRYPPLSVRAAPMLRLAGVRVDPRTHSFHAENGFVRPTLRRVSDGRELPLALPDDAVLFDVLWTADGDRFALSVGQPDGVSLWVGEVDDGKIARIPDLRLAPILGSEVSWLPDQERLLVKRVDPAQGAPPEAPLVPEGPAVLSSTGGAASSTYEARDVLTSPYDEALFAYYAASQLTVVDPRKGTATPVGPTDLYGTAEVSPDGKYLLVQRLEPPWSHQHAWWRFGHAIEVWTLDGARVHSVATVPLASAVPIHGVPEGPRSVQWRPTADATLVWVEALDGGDPIRPAAARDRVMASAAPFRTPPKEIFRAVHRVDGTWWGDRGLLVVDQNERERRWRHVWTVNADKGPSTARALFELSENDRYADPGTPLTRLLPNGRGVLEQVGDDLFFVGPGGSPGGDRPFLDRRSLKTGKVERLFRSTPETYERFLAFVNAKRGEFLIRREAPETVPNVHRVTLGARTSSTAGEAGYARSDRPVTAFVDPTPQLRKIQKRIVTYTRADGTPLSFTLYLPPDYVEGTRLPTVLYAYPLEFSDPGTAGQITGSQKTFDRFVGPSHLFFLLRGYAVLHNTTMPVIGDPETAYDTFVEQLVADAGAAIDQAVALGVTDPERVGVMGHSHGALMTATLLAHSDLFRAGIARSGAYNHTIRPFGFQSERRTLWEAPETYTALSPVMFAPQVNEPLLLIHGAIDENPGTVPLQSERLFEAIRGTGGTVRFVSLPFEGHGYVARESVEHVLWEQISWFDEHVKNAAPRTSSAESSGPGVQP